MHLPRIVCVIGPTSSGKTALGIRLAKKFHGEIINADSRQIYKDFNIGTGKPDGKRGVFQGHRAFLYEGVPHYLMDFLDPTLMFSVVEWREKAVDAIKGIAKRGHLPIVVGGTGLYVSSLIDNFDFPKVPPSPTLRAAFEAKPLEDLVKVLLKLDPEAKQVVDLKNPRRVIRALEVATFTGKPFTAQKLVARPQFDVFQIGIRRSREELYQRIDAEIENMVERGWAREIEQHLVRGISEHAPAMSSIGYREMLKYVKGETSLEAAIEATKRAVHKYAKRQETWFKRDIRIRWAKNEAEAVGMVKEWLD
jgi:tRNA dimethylallyltransferase